MPRRSVAGGPDGGGRLPQLCLGSLKDQRELTQQTAADERERCVCRPTSEGELEDSQRLVPNRGEGRGNMKGRQAPGQAGKSWREPRSLRSLRVLRERQGQGCALCFECGVPLDAGLQGRAR